MIVKLGGWELDLALLITFKLVLGMGSLLRNMILLWETFIAIDARFAVILGCKARKKNKMGASV